MALGSDNRTATSHAGAQVLIDEGLRQYMLRVYNYMTSGLALTGITAWVTAQMSVVTDADGNGTYEVIVTVSDGSGNDTQAITAVVMAPPIKLAGAEYFGDDDPG